MKATLEFDLSLLDDKEDYDYALAGRKNERLVEDVFSWIRQKIKYTELKDNQHDILEELREFMSSEINQD
jgi:hypothetical protein